MAKRFIFFEVVFPIADKLLELSSVVIDTIDVIHITDTIADSHLIMV